VETATLIVKNQFVCQSFVQDDPFNYVRAAAVSDVAP
jgi:hypothetical protein